MHRVFRAPPPVHVERPAHFERIRAALYAGGCSEQPLGEVLLYFVHLAGDRRHFGTLSGGRHSATLYLYPDALGGAAGIASRFYRTLDEADLNLGSKAGPSIGIDLADTEQVRLVCDGLRELLAGTQPPTAPPETSSTAPVVKLEASEAK
ncbi:MAG TPA: hypothetical protein VFD32_09645 [Dehalococcoidia bacterium]|nr:hypothetical protein [Dehalococcoidia bacterium]